MRALLFKETVESESDKRHFIVHGMEIGRETVVRAFMWRRNDNERGGGISSGA